MTLRNRTVMPPIGSNFATVSEEVSEEMIKYYELRAKGGTGLIIVENACVDFPMQPMEQSSAGFSVMAIDSVRAAVGPRFPISMRVFANDMLKGGNTLEDSLKLMEFMQGKVDFLNISVAQNDNLYLRQNEPA
jgi:2,4-dienoyl-CoA reductase-like NADH-dependent reductase (Old Yellow Enzyme family)